MTPHEYQVSIITDHLSKVANSYPIGSFGPEHALLAFGRQMKVLEEMPPWLRLGRRRECYSNCVKSLLSRLELCDVGLSYAEGYAISKGGLWLPRQHAWLVDRGGMVIDPTWEDSLDEVYFGITFKTSFVLDMLEKADLVPGVLVDPTLMRRHFGSRELFEETITHVATVNV